MKVLVVGLTIVIALLLMGLVIQAREIGRLKVAVQELKSSKPLDLATLPPDAAELVAALQRLGKRIEQEKEEQEEVLRLLKEAIREHPPK